MKYYKLMSNVWALVMVLSLGFSLIFAGFGELHNAMFACSVCCCAFLLHIMYAQLGKPKSWSGPHCG